MFGSGGRCNDIRPRPRRGTAEEGMAMITGANEGAMAVAMAVANECAINEKEGAFRGTVRGWGLRVEMDDGG